MTYLDAIVRQRRTDVAREKHATRLRDLRRTVAQRNQRCDFLSSLQAQSPAIIAEVKRASPSAGVIVSGCDPALVARQYEAGGAAAISVLTERCYFDGSFQDLAQVRSVTALPVLCKDFIIDEFQVWQAAAHGADAVLLIAALLDDQTLASFVSLCDQLVLSALVEIHNEQEVERAIGAGARLIGINNRDLRSFSVDRSTAPRIRGSMPPGYTTVAESGYQNVRDVAAAAAAGIDAVLVGEALMRAADPAAAVRDLVGALAWSG